MIDQVWRHTEARRIANTKIAFERRVETNRCRRRFLKGEVISLNQTEMAQQITGEHFCCERSREVAKFGIHFLPIGHAKFSAAIDRCRPIQVTNP